MMRDKKLLMSVVRAILYVDIRISQPKPQTSEFTIVCGQNFGNPELINSNCEAFEVDYSIKYGPIQ